MECSVCKKNPAVAKCSFCSVVICKTCGVLCPSCQKPICRTHLTRLPDGKIACRLCAVPRQNATIPKRVEPTKAPNTTPVPDTKREKISLSFEDLASELGDIRIKVSDRTETEREEKKKIQKTIEEIGNETVENPFAISREPQNQEELPAVGYKHLKRKPSDDPNEFRILTASTPKPTPMWISGLVSALLAFILSIPLLKNISFPPLFAYSILLLGGGSIFWNGYGFFQSETTSFGRLMHIAGILLSLIAIVVGFFFGLR